MGASVGRGVNWLGALFGVHAGPFDGPHIAAVAEVAHVAGLAVALSGVAWAAVRGVRALLDPPERDAEPGLRLESCLVLAFIANAVVFEFLTLSGNDLYARYLTASAIFATIAGGRLVARIASMAGDRDRSRSLRRRQRVFVGAGCSRLQP